MKKEKTAMTYIVVMSLLLVLTVFSMKWNDDSSKWINFFVWFIFTMDMLIRFYLAKNKFLCLGKNLFGILACIPFHTGYRFFKIFPLILILFEDTKVGRKYILPTYDKITSNKWGRIVISVVVFLIIMPIPLVWIEPKMNKYSDVLWWMIQTTTTVGYGDIVPVTFIGRLMGVLLMLIGIGLIGTVSSMLTRFLVDDKENNITDLLKKADTLTTHEILELEKFVKRKKAELAEEVSDLVHKEHPAHKVSEDKDVESDVAEQTTHQENSVEQATKQNVSKNDQNKIEKNE